MINENKVMWDDSPVDVTSEVNFIWSIANKLRGPYKSDKYKDVIIPMVIIRRFECALEDTKNIVVAKYENDTSLPIQKLCEYSGFQFYNISRFNLAELLNDSDNIADNFRAYIKGFSANVQDIIASLEFDDQIKKMDEHDRLYGIVKAFSELNLYPSEIDNIKMGYIFEELIRKFSENAEAGDHYTGRDIIKVMVSILMAEGCDDLYDDNKVITILDQASGTGGMLSTAYDYIHRLNPTADVRLFSQEINPESYAMCLAEMLIKGQKAESIRKQDTMKADCFKGQKMRFVIENPPFGQPWAGKDAGEGVEEAVRKEFLEPNSRWGIGLPTGGDMQLLFMQSAIDKMDDKNGRTAIIENGSPLFTGDTASGESQIRRWMLEQDLIEAIIALPTDLFYNTGIATYIWILSKNKREERKGKIQLIDATSIYHKLRKPLGNKKNEFKPEDRKKITELYADFKSNEFSKIYDNEEFIYREYAVYQPLQRSYGITEERINNMLNSNSLSTLYDESKVYELENLDELKEKDRKKLQEYYDNKPLYDEILTKLKDNISNKIYLNKQDFEPILFRIINDKKIVEKIADGLSLMDKNAEIQKDKKGIIYDKDTKDIEIVKWQENIEDYMKREVLPFVPDAKAFFEENLSAKKPVIKVGAEIPITKYFYKYQKPESSVSLKESFIELEKKTNEQVNELLKEG